ncbi:hypothetical protein Tco_1188793 [Tanacetum coccineum]
MEQYYNQRVRLVSFKPGKYVFRQNEAIRVEDQGKLGPKWERPYKVTKVIVMAQQQIIPADQLVPKFQSIGRCNNYVVLHNIPCSPECKIVGQLLLDYPLSYALTATADVPVEIVYTVDMFRYTLNLPVETTDNPFIEPTTMKFIQPFMQIVRHQGVVDKLSAYYTKFLAQLWQTMIKRVHVDYVALLWWDFLNCRLEEDYHSIKDDIPLMSVYTTENVTVKGMLILDAFITDEIRSTTEYKEYENVFVR